MVAIPDPIARDRGDPSGELLRRAKGTFYLQRPMQPPPGTAMDAIARAASQTQAPPPGGPEFGELVSGLPGVKKGAQDYFKAYGAAAESKLRGAWANQWRARLAAAGPWDPQYFKLRDLMERGMLRVEDLGDPEKFERDPEAFKTAEANAVAPTETSILPETMRYAQSALTEPLKTFDQGIQAQLAGISSASTANAANIGGEAAGYLAAVGGSRTLNRAPQARELVSNKARKEVDAYIETALTQGAELELSKEGISTASKLQIEQKSVSLLADEVEKAIKRGELGAGAQTDALRNAIAAWNTALTKKQNATAQKNAVLRAIIGAVGGVAGMAFGGSGGRGG